jgi:hypothetical protein
MTSWSKENSLTAAPGLTFREGVKRMFNKQMGREH